VRVLLVSANTERINMPTLPLGLHLVAEATRRAGHVVEILDLMGAPDPEAATKSAAAAFAPDAVGISVRNIDDQEMESPVFLLAKVRDVVAGARAATKAPVVLGGAGYSIFPEAALAYLEADYGVAGEGEFVFPRLLEKLERGEDPSLLMGVHVRGLLPPEKQAIARDLDRAAFPADYPAGHVDPVTEDLWVPVQSRRGCPLDCSYCSTPKIEGRSVRLRAASSVADEVERIAARGFPRIHFVDNTFNLPERYAIELCEEIAARGLGIGWRGILYPRKVSDALVDAMARSGCRELALGFESGAPEILTAMGKRFTVDDVREAAAKLRARGILRMGFLLLGGPGETRETVTQSLDFLESLDLDLWKITVGIRIYPDSPLHRSAIEDGLVDPDDDLLGPRFYMVPGLLPFIREEIDRRGL
jgi:radical SAM superfamily enzyme YgiQ (UPF0313 family)